MSKFERWYTAILFWLVVFNTASYFAYMAFTGNISESGQLQKLYIGIFVLSMLMIIRDQFSYNLILNRFGIFLNIGLVIFLYWLSSWFVPSSQIPKSYYSELLCIGSIGVSAIAIGTHMAHVNDCRKEIEYLMPILIPPMTILIGSVGLSFAASAEMVHDTSGLNYQSISYASAEFYAYSLYFLFFSSIRGSKYYRIMKWIMLPTMAMGAITCLLSGGRGAFLFLICVSVYAFIKKYQTANRRGLMIGASIIGVFGLFALASYFNVWDSVGFNRVISTLTVDDARDTIRDSAIEAFSSSPVVGHGFGSIWWTVGIYSHNIVTDWLAEGGIIGTILLFMMFFKMSNWIRKKASLDPFFILLAFILIKNLLENCVSGYWFANGVYWLFFGYYYTKRQMRQL